MKRLISILTAAILLLSLFLVFAAADSAKTAHDTVKDGILSCDESITVNSYSLNQQGVRDLMADLLENEPMIFHCGNTYRYTIWNNIILEIYPNYNITGEELEAARDFVETEISFILDSVPDGLDDFEKAVYLHDYICVNFAYDLNYEIYDIYELLKQDVGVCMAYSLLYDELLLRLGIETRAVDSDALDHMWNEVKLDGLWYHVDVTWDDPTADRYGKASHANFLKSDSAISESHNREFELDYPCTDTKYDSIDWGYIDRPFGFVDGDMYMLDGNVISKVDIHTGKSDEIFTASGRNIGFGSYDNWLYYNSESSIMRYDPKSNTAETVYTPDQSQGKIIGMYMSGNIVNYLASPTGRTEDGVRYTYTIEKDDETDSDTESDNSDAESDNSDAESDNSGADSDPDISVDDGETIMLGDIDEDGSVSVKDYILVKRSCLKTYTLSAEQSKLADIDGDERIDVKDYVLIKRIVLGTYKVK